MKVPSVLLFLLLGLIAVSFAAEEGVASKLDAFQEKLSKVDSGNNAMKDQFISQIRAVQGMIARGEAEHAGQILTQLSGYGLPADLQRDWSRLVEELRADLEKKQSEAMEKWRNEVDQLVKDTRKECLEAKTSEDLDSLLIRCAAVQMRRDSSNNVMTERLNRKVMGVAATLRAWMDYLDFQNAMDPQKANEALKKLRRNEGGFPILTAEEIDARFLPPTGDGVDFRTAVQAVYKDIRTPEDLPAALEKIRVYTRNPVNSNQDSFRSEERRLNDTLKAWQSAKAGNVELTLRQLSRLRMNGGSESFAGTYELLMDEISSEIIRVKAGTWSKLSQNRGENPAVFLDRIKTELAAQEQWEKVVEVIQFGLTLNPPSGENPEASDRQNIYRYLAGQRLENAGDVVGALVQYRGILGAPAGDFSPISQTMAALKRIQENNPEIFKSDNQLLLSEIAALRKQLQTLSGSGRLPGGRPGSP